jgi:eukaryotic-like serine/threonine-protein kinase
VNWRGVPRRAFLYLLAAATGFLAAYLILFIFAFPAEVIPDEAQVPNVVGMTFDRAARALGRAGFTTVEGESRFHRVVAAGVVLQQDPPADSRQKRGIEVRLAVSAGQRSSAVPQLTGMTEQAARIALANTGFELGTINRQNSDNPRGMVFMSDPPPGAQVQLPAAVNLVISEGPAIIIAPDLIGRTLPEARSLLEQIGLRLGNVSRDTNSFQVENTVIRQVPAGGQPVTAGGTVNVVVSEFPVAAPVPMDTLPVR